MKILIVSQYYYPEQFHINEIAPELVKHGHDVTVLTGLPNYPEGIISEEYKHGRRRNEVVDGVRVIRCSEIGRKKGKIYLILNYISFALSGCMKAMKLDGHYDVVLCYQLSPITMVAPAVCYKIKNKKPILLYCLDIWPESAQAHISNIRGIVYRAIARYSARLYNACDRIAVSSEPFKDYLHMVNGVCRENITYIPQFANSGLLETDLTAAKDGITVFMFAGNLGHGQKIETIIKAAALLKNRNDFFVHIVGDGSMRTDLEKLSFDLGVCNKVLFQGAKPRSEMPKWYRNADVLLITLRGDNYVGNTMPGKLQTYMTTGKPIIGSVNGAAKVVIEEAKCGACVSAEDAEGLSILMLDYIEHSEKYMICGMNARKYFAEHFTLHVFMAKMESELRALVDK